MGLVLDKCCCTSETKSEDYASSDIARCQPMDSKGTHSYKKASNASNRSHISL